MIFILICPRPFASFPYIYLCIFYSLQTWENPEILDEATGCKGDNDPIDVLEIGYRVAKRGEVLQVKVLGTVALIDEGNTKFK